MNTITDEGGHQCSSNVREFQGSERREPNRNLGRNRRGEWVPNRYSHPNRNPNWNFNPNAKPNINHNWDFNANPNPNEGLRAEGNRGRGHYRYWPAGSSSRDAVPSRNGQNQQYGAIRGRGRGNLQRNNYSRNNYNGRNEGSYPHQNYTANDSMIGEGNANEACSLGQSSTNEAFSVQSSTNEAFSVQSSTNEGPSNHGNLLPTETMRGRGRGNLQRNNYSRNNHNGRNERSYPHQNYTANESMIGEGNANEAFRIEQRPTNQGFSVQSSTNYGFIGPSNHNHLPTETTHYMKQMDFRDDRNKMSSSDRSNVPQMVQEIEEKLSKGQVECMICYDEIEASAPVWSCGICYVMFHLHCIRKWADSSAVGKSQGASNWRCPGCQTVQNSTQEEIRYYCFCGKVRDPEVEFYITPHSCGGPCGKPLDKGNKTPQASCPHTCILQCHPGPCPTCTALALPRPCPCGKTINTRRCTDKNSIESSCGKQCEKLLGCKRHCCENICHEGPCDPCKVLINASCFCRKKQEKILCGEVEIQGELDCDNGVFQCENVCMKMLSCQNHECSQRCHPGECGECEMLPEKVKFCPCGKTQLKNNQRKSCMDPVPTCSEVCEKPLPCGKHLCRNTCHNGECAPCCVSVNLKCRCSLLSRTVPCWETTENENENFRCEKLCGQKKNCGKHRCNERCCPFPNRGQGGNSNPHLCVLICEKKLQCGQHLCKELCHSGHCPPCLQAIFDDLSCACGKTSIPPPQPCGTPIPFCSHPCSVPQPCGHSATHNCHQGDCPPCTVPVSKACVGNHIVKDLLCGSQDILCNNPCGKTRQCGIHACARTCHLTPCDSEISSSSSSDRMSCGQLCGAPMRDCKHTCTAPCHPSTPCSDTRCKSSVQITCSCGRLTAQVPCEAGGNNMKADPVFEALLYKLPAPLQPLQSRSNRVPIGQRQLVCNDDCAKLKKNSFGLCTTKADLPGVNAQISNLIKGEPEWVSDVEERFKYLVLYRTKRIRLHVFCAMPKEKRDALKHLAERCNLSVYSAGRDPRCFLIVQATVKSRVPLPSNIDHKRFLPKIGQLRPLPYKSSVDMDPGLVIGLFDLPCNANMSSLILRFGGECELVWLNDNNALVIFKDQTKAATALRIVNHASEYQGVIEAPE